MAIILKNKKQNMTSPPGNPYFNVLNNTMSRPITFSLPPSSVPNYADFFWTDIIIYNIFITWSDQVYNITIANVVHFTISGDKLIDASSNFVAHDARKLKHVQLLY